MNRRINPVNNATCVTSRGSVNYFLIPQYLNNNNLRDFKMFMLLHNSVVVDFNLYRLIPERSKLPDHYILSIQSWPN